METRLVPTGVAAAGWSPPRFSQQSRRDHHAVGDGARWRQVEELGKRGIRSLAVGRTELPEEK